MSAEPHFVYLKILQAIGPMDRGEVYEDPLAAFLEEHNLGRVTGGGTMQDRSGAILFAGIDLEVNDLDRSIPLIAKKLTELGAPAGSVLEYVADGQPVTVPIGGKQPPDNQPLQRNEPAGKQTWWQRLFGRGAGR